MDLSQAKAEAQIAKIKLESDRQILIARSDLANFYVKKFEEAEKSYELSRGLAIKALRVLYWIRLVTKLKRIFHACALPFRPTPKPNGGQIRQGSG